MPTWISHGSGHLIKMWLICYTFRNKKPFFPNVNLSHLVPLQWQLILRMPRCAIPLSWPGKYLHFVPNGLGHLKHLCQEHQFASKLNVVAVLFGHGLCPPLIGHLLFIFFLFLRLCMQILIKWGSKAIKYFVYVGKVIKLNTDIVVRIWCGTHEKRINMINQNWNILIKLEEVDRKSPIFSKAGLRK